METCHGRDPVEKLWRTMKSELDARSLMTKIDPATQGQIFIVWGAAVLHRMLADALEKAGLDMTVNEALIAMRKIRMMCMKDRTVAQTPPRKAKDIIVGLELEKAFPEYADSLASQIEARERTRKAQAGQKRRGRPVKLRLKADQNVASNDKKAEEKEEKMRQAAVIPHRMGRSPKK